jgi:hypothetical protein
MQVESSRGLVGGFVPVSAVARSVEFSDDMMHVSLADGRIISVPLIWFSSLSNATQSQLENYEISPAGIGIHWPDIDEDLSVAGLMAGAERNAR